MAGDWIKFETSTSDKPEVWSIASRLSIDPDAVVGERYEAGLPLWHACDRVDYTGINENQIFTGKQRKQKRRAYEPRMSRVISSGKKMRAE